MKKLILPLAAAALLCGLGSSARAGFNDTLVSGVQNTYQDVSREHVYYMTFVAGVPVGNGATGLQVGDVLLTFFQIEKDTTPGGPGAGFQAESIYGIASEQVAGFQTNQFGATTAANNQSIVVFQPTVASNPLSLQSLLAGKTDASGNLYAANIPQGTIGLVIDNPGAFPIDYVVNNPPTGATAQMTDYFQSIASSGTFRAAVGYNTWVDGVSTVDAANGKNDLTLDKNGNPNNDYFFTQLGQVAGVQMTGASATPTVLNSLGNGITFGNNFLGLSVLKNNTAFTFGKLNQGQDLQNHELVVTQAADAGANNLANFTNFGLLDTLTGNTGGLVTRNGNDAGVSDNASFEVTPFATGVPEPSSLALLAIGASSLFGAYCKRRRAAKADA